MKINKDEKQLFLNAEKKVKRIKMFYLHLVFYIIGVALISYNFYIIEEGEYTNNINALNTSTLVLWTVIIVIHAWTVFKGRIIFKKSWEDKKMEKFLDEDKESETKMWE
ncbi:2TM domain-containing protein [Winogradskyella sp.]|uniref:2TM domain-containing protein n=1 Tax=Winogradskyella sp. TaxID=1883156 RepID=UPI0025FB7731|nr:2TM domain-containing protein [Winogradskyella sp.]